MLITVWILLSIRLLFALFYPEAYKQGTYGIQSILTSIAYIILSIYIFYIQVK